ncbi:hypothetical protein FRC10_006597 [Ceratobasidium sp. 414]|nr:hypothetical protein FRC10_006597 [Ceratobasidium sp. 414]
MPGPLLTKSLAWAPTLTSDSPEPQGMFPICPSPDVLFRNVPNLSKTVKIIGTRAFAHGGYSDIWRGISWSGDVTQNVAIKIIRVAARPEVTTERLKKVRYLVYLRAVVRVLMWCSAQRISREVVTWSKAKHKNIMPFYGLYWHPDDTSNDLPAMVYPYCAAGTCTEYLKNNSDADRMDINTQIRQVADGLIYLHSLPEQVVHGDIKACNVLMRDDGTPMLADFGLSRIVAEISTGLTTSSSRGSYRWMSPELFGGVEDQIQVLVTAASDVWAFGCLCLEILTNLLPWASIRNDTGVMQAILIQRRQPSLLPIVESNFVGHILRHCWAYEPSDRPSMSDLVEALARHDPSALHRPHCILSPLPPVISESPPQILNNDSDTFTGAFSDNPLFSATSNQTKTPLARIPRQDEPLFTPLLSLVPCPPVPTPITPVSSDATGATPYMDSLGLTPSDSASSGPSSGLASRDEPLFDSPIRPTPTPATSFPGPERWPKTTRGARLSNGSLWPRTPSNSSGTLPSIEQDGAFRSDLWQKSEASTPSSTHTRSSSRGSFHYATPPRTESLHGPFTGPGPSRLSFKPAEGGYASDHSTVSSSQQTPVTPNMHRSRPHPGSDPRRQHPNLSIPPSPSPSHSSSHSQSPSYPHYNYFSPPPVPRQGAWSPTATIPRDFRPAQSTAIRITKPDGTPVILPSPVKERRCP